MYNMFVDYIKYGARMRNYGQKIKNKIYKFYKFETVLAEQECKLLY